MTVRDEPPRRRGRPAQITHTQVVDAACTIADAGGLEAVSMRAVSAALDVTPMGLYRYVPDKASLLEAMVEHVAAEYEYGDVDVARWRASLVTLARQQRALIGRHPWLPDLASRFHPMGAATLTYVETLLALFGQADDADDSPLETVGLFNGFVTTLAQAANRSAPPGHHGQADVANLLSTGRYPRFAALIQRQPDPLDVDAHFDRLVQRVIDGLVTGDGPARRRRLPSLRRGSSR